MDHWSKFFLCVLKMEDPQDKVDETVEEETALEVAEEAVEEVVEEVAEEVVEDPPEDVQEEKKTKKIPKKYEKASCGDCGKTMSLNNLRYKHVCPAKKPPPPPKATPKMPAKAVAKAAAKAVAKKPPLPKKEPVSPKTQLRDLYRQVRIEQLEAKRNRWVGLFD